VPLIATDFIEPAGELSTELFPGKDLTAFVTAWLAEAETKASGEAAQRAWVLHRAYTTVANRMHNDPALGREGNVQSQTTDAQIAHWRERAIQERHEFEALTGRAVGAYLQPTGYEP
jgi:hypothetical protein